MAFGHGDSQTEAKLLQRLRGQAWRVQVGFKGLLIAGLAAAFAVLFGSEHMCRWVGEALSVVTGKLGEAAVLPTRAADSRRRVRRVVAFRSESDAHLDIYFDDGRLGVRMSAFLPKGEALMLSVHEGDRFFYTLQGQRERIVDRQGHLVESVINSTTQEVLLPADIRPQGSLCLDRYRLCAREAAEGRCRVFPGWMIPNCCASCDSFMNASRLLDPAVRCHRETLNTTGTRAWNSGDLHLMFLDIKQNHRWAQYMPVVLSEPPAGPWMILLDTFLNEDECAAFITGGEVEGFHQSEVQKEKASAVNAIGEFTASPDSSRTSSTAWCSKARCGAHPLVQQVIRKVEELTGISRANFEQAQILSYALGQRCRAHQDSKPWLSSMAAGLRILTVFFYLSDVEAGGETFFQALGLRVAPKKGAALIWPNVLDEDPDELDNRFFHESLSVKSGLKRAANLWVHMYDVEVAEKWGC